MYPANESGLSHPGNSGLGHSGLGNGRLQWRHALAGLQAGVMGALLIMACLMIGSLWNGRSIWVVPNLFATTFFGSEVYRNQFLRTSWTGAALIVAIYGLLGVLWGCVLRDGRSRWLGLIGAIAGICVYYFLYQFLWRHVNPLITLYAPDRQLELGHILWGIVLARSPVFARRIAGSSVYSTPVSPPVSVVPAVHDDSPSPEIAGDPEVRSGEVIR